MFYNILSSKQTQTVPFRHIGDSMGRYTGKKNRVARRFGANVFGRKRNPLMHKQHPPGMHGARRKKKSDFGVQLEEKQKLKAFYGMLSEKQLVTYFQKAERKRGNTMTHLMEFLESRLDTVVYRMGFGRTMFAAHQLVAHGHVEVDGKKVDIRSFIVQPGMTVSIREKSRGMKCIQASLDEKRSVPEYLSVEPTSFTGKFLALPAVEQIPLPEGFTVNIAMVAEHLAHNN